MACGTNAVDLIANLKKHFGYDEFRRWQRGIIRNRFAPCQLLDSVANNVTIAILFDRRKFLLLGLSLFAFTAPGQENPSERGDAAMNAGNYAEAVAAYTDAINREPNKAGHYIDRTAAYDLLNEVEKALADANKAIQLEPRNAAAYDARAWVKYTRKPNEEALADLTNALELEPKFPRALNHRARILADERRFKEALADVNNALEYAEDYADAYTTRGNIFYLQ